VFQEPDFKRRRVYGREPVRLLLVEDDPQFADLLQTQLRRMRSVDARLEVARSLAEAQAKLQAGHFGLVITDLSLPDSRGVSTVDALARVTDQPIIVLTGDSDQATRAAAMDCGAYDFLSKNNLSSAILERLVRLATIQAKTFGALRDAEQRFRSLITLSSDFYWESDASHRISGLEHGAERHPVANPVQIGKARWELPSTYPDAAGWAAHRATMDAHQPFSDFEIARLDEDGVERYRSISGEPMLDAAGVFVGYRGIGRDVTARKRAEEDLRQFRLAMDHSADIIVLIDPAALRFVDVNRTACELLGYTREELLAMGPQDVLPVSRADLERSYADLVADPANAGGMNSYYRCKDGSRLPFESTRRVLRSGNKWIIAAISRDIRERVAAEQAVQESEARFRSLTALSSDWYWEQDAEFRLTFMSNIEELGLDASQYLGRKRWETQALNLTDADWARHRAQLERHEPFQDFEVQRAASAGATVWLALSGEPVFDASGAFTGYRGVGRDISRRKRAEQEVRRLGAMYAALGAANEAILRAGSPEEVFRRACEIAVEAGGFLIGTVFLLDRASSTLSRAAASGPAARLVEGIAPSMDETQPGGRGLIGHACRTGKPAISNDYATDQRTEGRRSLVRSYEVGSAAVYPLQVAGELVGVFGLQHAQRDAFSDELTGLLQRLADNISFALGNFRQDAKRRKAKRKLRESEERFRGLTTLSSDMYWQQDEEYRFTEITGSAGEWMSSRRTELLGKRRWEQQYFNMAEADWAAHRAVLEARQPFRNLELGRVNEAGEKVWVSVSGEPMFDAAGAFKGYRGVGTDITARKREEQALREFRAAMDTSADMIMLVDRETLRYVDVNATACELQGYTREEMLRMGPLDVSPVAREKLERDYDAMIASGETTRLQSFHHRKDGTRIPVEIVRRAVRAGERWIIVSILRDIRERVAADDALRKSEERFRSLTKLSSDWYWEQDAHFRFVKFEGKGGAGEYEPATGVLGKCPWELPGVVPDSIDWDRHRARLERHESFRGLEYAYRDRSGRHYYVSVDGEPVFDDGGRFTGYRGTSRDVTRQRRDAEELRRFRAAMDMSLDAIYLTDRATMRFIDVNKLGCKALGYSREELLTKGPQDVLPATREQLEREYDAVIAEGSKAVRVETSYAMRDDRRGWSELHRRALREGDHWIIVTISRDITERKLAEQRQATHLRHQERIARFGQSALARREPTELIEEAVQHLLEGLNADAVAYVEPGTGEQDLVLRALAGVADGAAGSGVIPAAPDDPLLQMMRSGARVTTDGARLQLAWARDMRSVALVPLRGERGTRGALCIFYARADALGAEELNLVEATASVLSTGLLRIESEGRLAYLAQFDPLTGLPNRALLADRFAQMIVQAKRHHRSLGVLFIDLDGFKMVNDTLGHAGGDELLKETAVRLQSCVRPGDTVARISGDEFAVVLADLAKAEDAAMVAQKVLDRLGAAFEVHGQEVFVTASIGIAGYPGDGTEAEALIGAADAAMYRAKQAGRNGFQFFTADINQRTRARAQLGGELRRALEREEFVLFYQPKFELRGRKPHGAEALLRWRHPERGLVSPAEFIPVLEETGLIVQVGEWVIRRACEDLKAWLAAGLAVGPVAVNLSARQFRMQDLDARIKALVQAAAVDPALIELEITESQLMQDPEHAIRVMRSLCDAGMRIAIDDFGTGYSSLSYLTRFPIGALKIDRSFVADVNQDPSDATIVRTIIEMAHSLGFTVVAEGVETEEQATFLRLLRCEHAQGYLFARPMPAADLAKLFAR
jgi:diguanylate cyclase (GGDEF)-like protein/PAS domain S-box-containing protein